MNTDKETTKKDTTELAWNKVGGAWNELKGEVKKQWGKFSDDDVKTINGRKDELVGRIMRLYGVSEHEAKRQVIEFTNRLYQGKAGAERYAGYGTHNA